MKNEKEFKTLFRKCVRQQKGFSLPLAAPMFAGLPDMWVCMPGYMPILLEAKYLGIFIRNTFKKKIPFSPIQKVWLQECHKTVPYSAMGLLGFRYADTTYAVLVDATTEILTHDFLFMHSAIGLDKETKTWNIRELFRRVPIPRLEANLGLDKDALDRTSSELMAAGHRAEGSATGGFSGGL